MNRMAFALLFVPTIAFGGTYPYEAAFNEHSYSSMSTETMTGTDMAVMWFVTPAEGKYLVQVSNAPDSVSIPHQAVLLDAGTGRVVSLQTGNYPSFYVTVGGDLTPWTGYLLYVLNVNPDGSPSCQQAMTCNVNLLIQAIN